MARGSLVSVANPDYSVARFLLYSMSQILLN